MRAMAEDAAALVDALGLGPAHVAGLSLGAATGIWLAAKYPDRVKTLSLHNAWPKSDPFLRTVVEGWQVMARGFGTVADVVITGIFPWCFTPEFYSAKTEYIQSLADFVRGRPRQPVEAFLRQTEQSSVMTPNHSWPGSRPPRWSPSAVLISSARCALPTR